MYNPPEVKRTPLEKPVFDLLLCKPTLVVEATFEVVDTADRYDTVSPGMLASVVVANGVGTPSPPTLSGCKPISRVPKLFQQVQNSENTK